MYTKILAQGTKFGSGITGLDNPALQYTVLLKYSYSYMYRRNIVIQQYSEYLFRTPETKTANKKYSRPVRKGVRDLICQSEFRRNEQFTTMPHWL